MLRDLELYPKDLLSKRPFKVQLAQPNKVITQNINNVSSPSLSDIKINSLPQFEFEIPYMVKTKSIDGSPEVYIKNPDLILIQEEKLIKLTWYKNVVNWFRIVSIDKVDGEDSTTVKITASGIESELRKTNVSIKGTGIGAEEYFKQTLEQSAWKLGYISKKLGNTFRSFDGDEKQTRYEAIQKGIETFGAIADFDGETRTLNLFTIDEIRINRGVVLKRENFANSIEINSTSEDIVTRLYGTGNEDLTIAKANPTGMRYIEDFSYFLYPFKRDENKNVIEHSHFMSDGLSHALTDLIELQKIYEPQIKQHQDELNTAYSDLSKAMLEKAELDNQLITLQSLLDTAKATNDTKLIAQREQEVTAKKAEITAKQEKIDNINASIEAISKEMDRIQELISISSFTPELREELSLFIYEKDFNDDRYIDAPSLYDATVKEFEKYQKPTKTFTVDMASFLNSIQGQRFNGKLKIGEEVTIRSEKFDTEYTSIILGIEGELETGNYRVQVSDNMDDIDSMDKLASIIYKSESSSTILENNKYKWDNITSVKDEVTNWRDKEINTVNNRIIAGANESITIDNRGMMVRNPDFPNEVIIIQSGVVALSKDGGQTWSTSITPNGVIAETLIGKILAGNNLIITNDSGSFVIDNSGMTIDMDSIRIMSGESGNKENVIESWNKLLLTYQEIASDNLVNEYEKSQLKKQWSNIVDIHSSMISAFEKGWKKRPVPEPDPDKPAPDPEMPKEYNDYITAYEALNEYLNVTKQSDGFALLDPANAKETTTIDPEEFKQVFKDYETTKQALESIISFEFTSSQIIMLETGIALQYVKNGNIVTALNLSEEGVRIDGKLLEINSKTEFNADLTMNAGVIRGKDDGIVIDLNTGKITLNTKVEIGAGSNLVTDTDLEPLKGQVVATLTNDYITIFTDPNGSSGNYSLATTEMTIYRNGNIDNNNWKFSVEKNNNVVMTQSNNQLVVSSIKTDSEVITLVATSGKEVVKKQFKVVKYKDTSGNINRWISITDSIHKSIFDEWIPSQLTVLGNQQVVGQDMTSYKGRYKVYESKDGGINYLVKYTSSADEDILKYTPTEKDITHIKVQFYLAGNTLNLIDEQVLPVIKDQEKSYTHTAYSWSSDGKDRFTTEYPNLNLLTNSRFQSGSIAPFLTVNNAVLTINQNVKGLNISCSGGAIGYQQGVGQLVGQATAGNQYTISVKVINTGTVAIDKFLLQFGFYNSSGTGLVYPNKIFSIPADGKVYSLSYTVTAPANTTSMRYYCLDTATVANTAHTFTIYDMKDELGSIATPWMPSSSEVKNSDYPNYIGTEISNKYNSSQNPEDYEWIVFKGEDGNDGIDSLTVSLTNDSTVFAGDTSNALASSTSTNVIGFVGNVQKETTVGTISGLPTGMTATVSNNNTKNTSIKFDVTTAMVSKYGSVTIPITVGSNTVEKMFSYSVAFKGFDGKAGVDAIITNLSNDSVIFSGDTSNAIASSTTTTVTALQGAKNIPVSVGTISGLPTGMTSSVTNNGTNSVTVKFDVTDKLVQKNGNITIPVTAGGVSVNQIFSYAIAFKGTTGNDGKNSYLHTAYATSADGKEGFTTVYPNLNLLDGTSSNLKTTSAKDWGTPPLTANKIDFKKGENYTFRVWIQDCDINSRSAFYLWDSNNVQYTYLGNVITSGSSGFSYVTFSVPIDTARYSASVGFIEKQTNFHNLSYSKLKLETGSNATPYMPSSSEVKPSDYPTFRGEYSDNEIESSSDYTKYSWTVYKGEDSRNYKAWSWSSDGSDRFTTVYPDVNLLKGTSNENKITGTDSTNQGGLLYKFDNEQTILDQGFKVNDTITLEFDWVATNPVSGYFILQWQGTPWSFDLPKINISPTNNSGHIIYTFNIRDRDIATTAYATGVGYRFDNIPSNTTITLSNLSLKKTSEKQPWTPSSSEYQDDWSNAIPKYVGYGGKNSQNPNDYDWELNSDYVQISSESGLAEKANNQDLADVSEVANSALSRAENSVLNEDYTSWLEHDYQSTIDTIRDVSAQNQEDIKNVDDRTTIMEGFYGEMKVKWNFIDESFTFSEEGMFISNAQSKMAIQVTSDKIVFWDNNVDVAFITGEVLNIQKGVFLESATIGNHLITKFSDNSPVTIIRYVGGIN